MSSDTDNQRKTERSLERQHWSCAAALALAAASVGCALDGVRPMASLSAGSLSAGRSDRGTCEGLYVQSIWKGEDLSGPECASYAAPGGTTAGAQELEYDRRRVQKVCEQAQLRKTLHSTVSDCRQPRNTRMGQATAWPMKHKYCWPERSGDSENGGTFFDPSQF